MRVPEPFDLDLTVRSHGWYDLPPWRYDDASRVLGRPLLLPGGRTAYAEVAAAPGGLGFRALAEGRLAAADARAAQAALRTCLSLDEDLSAFFAARRRSRRAARPAREQSARPALAIARGAGRLLRSPTVFEDAVKTLCTTNCSWGLTRAMVTRLCDVLGLPAPLGTRTFPTPEAMASRLERFYREEDPRRLPRPVPRASRARRRVRRAGLEALRTSTEPTDALATRIRALAGFGPYATEHLLRLLCAATITSRSTRGHVRSSRSFASGAAGRRTARSGAGTRPTARTRGSPCGSR